MPRNLWLSIKWKGGLFCWANWMNRELDKPQERKAKGKGEEKSGFNIWAAGLSHRDPFIYSPLHHSPPSGESCKSHVWSCSQNLSYIHAWCLFYTLLSLSCNAAILGLVLSCCLWLASGSSDGDIGELSVLLSDWASLVGSQFTFCFMNPVLGLLRIQFELRPKRNLLILR